MSITFVEMPLVATNLDDEGVLVLENGRLAAVVSRLSDPEHGSAQGQWFVEAGFGQCAKQMPPFQSLEEVAAWVADCLGEHEAVSRAQPKDGSSDQIPTVVVE